ncbi:MAG: hypothetical protein NE327_05270 [Lentisphaeraceae bacterium]|nr:hypothetical protein [Lentisphaeraceae bacterium]
MSFSLDNVIPWGRSFSEYRKMFSLEDSDLAKKILGCGDGPASFNAELSEQDGEVISADPLYSFSAEQIKERVRAVYHTVLEKVEENKNEFVWDSIKSVQHLGELRKGAMELFLKDYQKNRDKYINCQLPDLPFNNSQFDLALCSHFLFLYSEHHSLEFHLKSIEELCRVAGEVRIFPLLELGSVKSRHLEEVLTHLDELNIYCEIQKVEYEFQKGGNEMLILKKVV